MCAQPDLKGPCSDSQEQAKEAYAYRSISEAPQAIFLRQLVRGTGEALYLNGKNCESVAVPG
jgi:hypothetical protein